MTGLGPVFRVPKDPEPERDPVWESVYARIYPIKTGWTVRIDLRLDDDDVSFFYLVNPINVEQMYGGWTTLLDGFVRAIDRAAHAPK